MDKKVVLGIAAVLTFFAGAIWVSEVPIVATLVAFLELAAGCVYGYLFKKIKDNETITKLIGDKESLEKKMESLLKAQKTQKAKKESSDSKKK